MGQRKKAVVLLSGGVDSTTALAVARAQGYELYAITFRYGQRHQLELEAARRVARAFSVARHLIVEFDLRAIGGSALTDDIAVPKDRKEEEMAASIPVTYVPARNTIFLAFALAWAEAIGAEDIFFGANVLDYSVSGESNVWVRGDGWAKLMPMRDFFELPAGDYQTIAVDLNTGRIGWKRVLGRFCHKAHHKRCFSIRLESGQEITVTEDHSLFTVDPVAGRPIRVRGAAIKEGMSLVVASDLSGAAEAWAQDLESLDLSQLFGSSFKLDVAGDQVPIWPKLQITDDFLRALGIWLADGQQAQAETFPLAAGLGRPRLTRLGCDLRGLSGGQAISLFERLSPPGALPRFFWDLSQRQRRLILEGYLGVERASGSDDLVRGLYHSLLLDGISSFIERGPGLQKSLRVNRAGLIGVSRSELGGGLGLSRVVEVRRAPSGLMYDLSVEGAENFFADGFLAHNSGYPDCRPEYIEAFERMANLGTKAGAEGRSRFKIHTPLINMTKAEIIKKGLELGVDYSLTHSCYDPTPDGLACGRCDSCRLRLKGFAEAGVSDPAPYAQPKNGSTSC